jgi:uncharacterized RDD family membrane protein YckC
MEVKTIYVAPKLKRLLAYIIDILPITIIVFYIFISSTNYSVLFQDYLEFAESGVIDMSKLDPAFIRYTNHINMIVVVILGLYGAYAETTSWQGTFGKKLLKIKVGDSIGRPLDGGTAFKRNVMKIIVLSTLPLLMIWVLFDKKNRGPYDVIAKTLVVSSKDYSNRVS